ncbi:hypothetical protein [Flavobacterium sp. LB2R40]|uniref:hypothetical protein n=1 Tax=Flavobacterium sp. LB2R40 TaxID=3401722 RepID=UPI003AAAB18C
MKLTTEQVAQIEETLVLNGLVYQDVKLELLDHIASEIEKKICNETNSFEVAFKVVFKKWKPELRLSSYGLLLGRGYSGPKIIMDKIARYTKSRFWYITLGAIPLTLIVTAFIHFFNTETFTYFFTKALRTLFVTEVFLVTIAWIIIWKYKHKTTFSYLFKKRSILVFFQPLLLGVGLVPIKLINIETDVQMGFVYVFSLILLFFMIDFVLVFQHIRVIKKLSVPKS